MIKVLLVVAVAWASQYQPGVMERTVRVRQSGRLAVRYPPSYLRSTVT